jgi:hypothetical protein
MHLLMMATRSVMSSTACTQFGALFAVTQAGWDSRSWLYLPERTAALVALFVLMAHRCLTNLNSAVFVKSPLFVHLIVHLFGLGW